MKKRSDKKNNKDVKLNIGQQFKESLLYLKESYKYFYVSIFIFIISAVVGFTNSSRFSFIDDLLKEIISKTANLNALELTFFIMQNNMLSALLALAGGIFFGIMPIFNAISNGVVIGYVMSKSYQIAGASILFRLVPHGIFELPAIFISLGLGIKLGFTIIKTYFKFFRKNNNLMIIFPPLISIIIVILGSISLLINKNIMINKGLPPISPFLLFFLFGTLIIYIILMVLIYLI